MRLVQVFLYFIIDLATNIDKLHPSVLSCCKYIYDLVNINFDLLVYVKERETGTALLLHACSQVGVQSFQHAARSLTFTGCNTGGASYFDQSE